MSAPQTADVADKDRRVEARLTAIVLALESSGAPEAPRLRELLEAGWAEAADHDQQIDILNRYEQALAQRGIECTTLKDLLLNIANSIASSAADRLMFDTLKAVPGVGNAVALAQLIQAVYQRSWGSVGTALKLIAPLLPTLRSHEQFDALIRSLPETLRDQLHALHQWLQEADDALSPSLGLRHAGPALAVAAVLWHLRSRLPGASATLQGVDRFIVELPHHWSRLVGVGRLGGTLLAAPVETTAMMAFDEEAGRLNARRTPLEQKERLIAHLKAFNSQYAPGNTVTVIPAYDRPPVKTVTPTIGAAVEKSLEHAMVPGQPLRGGPIAEEPALGPDVATSSALSQFGNHMRAVLAALTTLVAGRATTDAYAPVVQQDREMDVFSTSSQPGDLDEVSVTTGLVDKVAPAAVSTAGGFLGQGRRIIRQNPLAAVGIASIAGLSAIGGALYAALRSDGQNEPSTADLIELLSTEVVNVGDAWGTGLDQLLGAPDLPGARRKRDVAGEESNTPLPVDLQQLGITAQQRDALLGDNSLRGELRALQTWALAVAQELATVEGWQWVGTRPASEQELLVHQLHVLRALEPRLGTLEGVPQQLLDEAANTQGVAGSTAGIVVDLGPVTAAGVTVQQRMPLLQYCLLRANGSTVDATFEREDGTPLTLHQHQKLHAFIGSKACAQLQAQVAQHMESLRPVLVTALRARMVVDALKAKAGNTLGSGNDYLRGADIVLGFLRGARDVESSTLTYRDTLADGTPVTITVPNYLVLRSASTDPALHGQVVLYRSDLASFRTFDNENAFRQYLDTERARSGLHVVNGALDRTLMEDIVAAATPAERAQVQERVTTWEERQANYQAGKGGVHPWNARDVFVLDFQPVTTAGHALDDWASVLVAQGQQREQQELGINRLRWSALGMALVDADKRYTDVLKEQVRSLNEHAKPEVTEQLLRSLRLAGIVVRSADFDPDRVQLRVNGLQMSLTAWATSGWQQHGLPRLPLPFNLGDMPGGPLMQRTPRLPDAPWPSDEDLAQMKATAYRPGGGVDESLSLALHGEDALRAICGVFEDFKDSNRLGDAYTAHLKGIRDNPHHPIHAAAADQIRAQTRWMIETANQRGQLGKSSYAALKRVHGELEPDSQGRSSLLQVTLNGHPVHGLWALETRGTHYVFVPGTEAGDQLMDESAFARWAMRADSKDYLLDRTALKYHDSLNRMFDKEQTTDGIKVGFTATGGPQAAATANLTFRLENVDEMTTTQLERLVDTLTIIGSVVAGVSCSFASGGSMAALCITSTLALLGKGIRDGVEFLDRGKVDDAIESIGTGLGDAIDVLNITALLRLFRQFALKGLDTVEKAGQALGHWRGQMQAFAPEGRVNSAFAVSTRSLSDTHLPMIESPATVSVTGPLFQQGERSFIQQDKRFIEVSVQPDASDPIRLVDPKGSLEGSDFVGAPVEHRDGQWQLKQPKADAPGTTTVRPMRSQGTTPPSQGTQAPAWVEKVPEARSLPRTMQEELEAVFGIRRPGASPSADLVGHVQNLAMEGRINQIVGQPTSLGLPGDEAIIMRAWADSPALGNGRSVETYITELDDWTRGARFGTGTVGLMVEVQDPRHLPGIVELIAASDQGALLRRLNLPEGSGDDVLHDAVRDELARTIAANPSQSLLTWKRWTNMQHRLPTAADNLIKHFPQLTKNEAEAVVNDNPVSAFRWLNWDFNSDDALEVADKLAERTRRKTRQEVLAGKFDSPSKVQELSSHLQGLLPGRSWRITSDPSGQGNVLTFTRPGDKENAVRSLTFETGGGFHRPNGNGGTETVDSWEQGIFDQLSPSDKKTISSSTELRASVFEKMKDTPLVGVCSLPKKIGKGKVVVKRGVDCDPPPSISLTPLEVRTRDELGMQMEKTRAGMAVHHAQLSREHEEYRVLAKKAAELRKEKRTLGEEELKRMRELETRRFGDLRSFDIMNFASYEVKDLTYDGVPVILPDSFPLRGTAASGNSRPALGGEDLLDGAPVRYVFLPEQEAVGQPTFRGMFREDYALGADLSPIIGRFAETGQGSKKLTLTEGDLRVTRPGTKTKVPVYELSDDEILKLTESGYSPKLRQVMGDVGLLPSNARKLRPGDYRVYQIRSCSEGKIMDGLFRSLSSSVKDLASLLWDSGGTVIRKLKGNAMIVSEMDPCRRSCDPRLTEMLEKVPGMKTQVLFVFDDNAHRKQWWFDQDLNAVIQKNRGQWELDGVGEADMPAMAEAELVKPEVKQWVEDHHKRNPPTLPVPRLWVPQEQIEF